MSISRTSRAGLLLGPLVLCSCMTTTQDYVLERLGFFSVKGNLMQVKNLTSGEMEALKDGTTVRVDGEGCVVTMECGEKRHEFEAGPGCIIVIGDKEDFLLQPIGEGELFPTPKVNAPDPAPTPTEPESTPTD